MAGRAGLVLGGGGITGAAWEIGMIAGLKEAGVDLTTADVVIGTSAGAVVGAQILSGVRIEELYERQLRPPAGEIPIRFGLGNLGRFAALMLLPGNERGVRARVGRAALRARTMTETARKAIIAGRLPLHEWPESDLQITAVDAETGELVVFKRDSGAELVDAVAASCAVPMVYPAITINGRHYIDGGVRSIANADLAIGCDPVVVLTPVRVALRRRQRVDAQLQSLGHGIKSIVVSADATARKAMGRQALDPAFRAASARAGKAQAPSAASAVADVWALSRQK
jgi:NTE family protein